MINKETASQVIKRIAGVTSKPVGVSDLAGNILAKTSNLNVDSISVDTKNNKKVVPIMLEGKKEGYLYFDFAPEVIHDETRVLKSLVELFLHQRTVLDNVSGENRKINKFIYDVLHRNKTDYSQIHEEAKIYDLDLKIPRIAIVVEIDGEFQKMLHNETLTQDERESFWLRVKRSISFSFESFYTRHKKNITAYIGGNRFVILKDLGELSETKENIQHFHETLNSLVYILSKELRAEITMGVGRYYKGTKGIQESFNEAILSIDFGSQVWGRGKAYHFDKFGVVSPLNPNNKNSKFSKSFFNDFSNKDELLKTLNSFFKNNMSLTATANELKIHRNTLVYRLDKIADTLDLDPRVFSDAIQIRLSMLFSDILN